MPNLGVWEILLILLVVLIVFGPKRLPEMGRSLGRGMREFKDSISTAVPTEEELEAGLQGDPNAERPVPTVVSATAAPSAPVGEDGSTEPERAPSSGGPASG